MEMIDGPKRNTNKIPVAVAPPVRNVMYRKIFRGLK
jgi:hypothetical protein